MDNKEAFKQALSARLEEYKAEFNKLKAQTKGAYAEGQLEGSEEGKSVKAKIEEAKLKLEKFEEYGDEKWEDFKADMEKTWNGIQNSLNKIKK